MKPIKLKIYATAFIMAISLTGCSNEKQDKEVKRVEVPSTISENDFNLNVRIFNYNDNGVEKEVLVYMMKKENNMYYIDLETGKLVDLENLVSEEMLNRHLYYVPINKQDYSKDEIIELYKKRK